MNSTPFSRTALLLPTSYFPKIGVFLSSGDDTAVEGGGRLEGRGRLASRGRLEGRGRFEGRGRLEGQGRRGRGERREDFPPPRYPANELTVMFSASDGSRFACWKVGEILSPIVQLTCRRSRASLAVAGVGVGTGQL